MVQHRSTHQSEFKKGFFLNNFNYFLNDISFRFGFGDSSESAKDPEDEVNEYLMRAIDARSIDHLRAEHCQSLLLCFKDNVLERKVKILFEKAR